MNLPSERPTPSRRWSPTRLALTATIISFVVLAACGSSSSSSQGNNTTGGTLAPKDGGSLVVAVNGETQGWNPRYDQTAQQGALVVSSVVEPLAITGHDLNAQPWLATSWTPNSTFTAWTIHLRTGVTFQDGEAFDAAAVKANLDDALVGALSGVAVKGLILGTTVVDPQTVQVNMSQPWAAFPSSWLDGQSAMMIAPRALAQSDHGASHPVGTGPFTFVSWTPGATFVTHKNVTYWRKGLPHLDSLTFKVITDPTTQASSLQSGDSGLIFTNSAQIATQLQGQFQEIRDWSTEPGTVLTNTLTTVNGKGNPLSNQHARLALAYATNRQAIASQAGAGVQSPNSPFPPNSPWGMPESQNGYVTYDVAKAKQQVAQYEQQSGQSSLDLTLSGTPDVGSQRTMQMIQAMWQQAGIKVTLQSADQATFITNVVEGNYQTALFSFYSSPDPDQNFYFWSSSTANGPGKISINFTQYTTPKIDADLKIGRENPQRAARKAAYDDIVRQINAAAVNIWTYTTPYSLIYAKNVHGMEGAQRVPFGNFQPKPWWGDVWVG